MFRLKQVRMREITAEDEIVRTDVNSRAERTFRQLAECSGLASLKHRKLSEQKREILITKRKKQVAQVWKRDHGLLYD